MTRLSIALFLVADVLLIAGIAGASTGLVVASIVVAGLMVVSLIMNDRADAKSAADLTASGTSVATPIEAPATTTTSHVAVLPDGDAVPAELLGRVQGLGPRRVESIAQAFTSTAALRAATKDDLVAIPGVGAAIADRILAELS